MATKKTTPEVETTPEVAYVEADFTGVAVAQNDPQPPAAEQIVQSFATDLVEYIAAQQRRINELEYELSRK
ncbi:hypothetical protein HUN08_12555 [Gordonia sp. X0973]|uniref:hypothetical protein n=1 Tax=Gordonia sp. X0973 TaxID=2742602 RepID=UPI000F51C47E|nr:hypothetical protein [Gordonia sp. X0973]QKT07925.1 hypothetical protein HUN08_12555 [Gordonia sp. X0973]